MKIYNIAVLPGDGIGEEVMDEALKVLDVIGQQHDVKFDYNKADVGGVAMDKHNNPLPPETLKICEESDAILFGAIGDPKWDHLPPNEKVEKVSLLTLRKHFNLYANLRPAICYSSLKHASPLKPEIVGEGFDILIVRELTGGIYFGKHDLQEDKGTDIMEYTRPEVERIAKTAFDIAMKRNKKVTCVDKANVLAASVLFRKVVTEIGKQYPEVELDFYYIDNATMGVLKNPQSFDVIVTTNMFGDILSDECAQLSGSIGMLPSASLNEKNFGMYEPSGGSAPKYKGMNVANPIAQILSAAMMLKYSFGMIEAHNQIESAVQRVLEQNIRTKDIADSESKIVGTKEMGDAIVKELEK